MGSKARNVEWIDQRDKWLIYGVGVTIFPSFLTWICKCIQVWRIVELPNFLTDTLLLVWAVAINCYVLYRDKYHPVDKKFKLRLPIIVLGILSLISLRIHEFCKDTEAVLPRQGIILVFAVGMLVAWTIYGCWLSVKDKERK